MRVLRTFLSSQILLVTALLPFGILAPAAKAQISIGIGIQPVCSYGYYDYSPYACAPVGFYGPGYFYNGIFLGMGPWAGWGYGHGWGSHRFVNDGGGRYHGGGGAAAGRAYERGGHEGHETVARSGGGENRAVASRPNTGHAAAPQRAPQHAEAPHGSSHASAPHGAPHAAAAHGGGESHGGGAPHGGGDASHAHGGGEHK
jgi:hypothetical protein